MTSASSIHTGWHYDVANSRLDIYYRGTRVGHVNSTGVTFVVDGGGPQIADDSLLSVGTGATARFSWDTTDANANEMLLQLPAGDSVDVPAVIIGQAIESLDLGLYNGRTEPVLTLMGSGAVATGAMLEFRKSRGTNAAPTVVTSGDDLGSIEAYAAVAAGEYVRSAKILFECTGSPATTRGPGVITFQTATDAAPSVLTTAMTISAAQLVTVASGASTGDFKLNLTLTAGADGVGASGEQLTSGGAAAETNWAAAACVREYKNVLGERTDADEVLALMVNTPVHDFTYKTPSEYQGHVMGTGDYETVYTGIMADEAPYLMHYSGKILNPINEIGYSLLAFKALDARLRKLEGVGI